jgi:hypothetical protein
MAVLQGEQARQALARLQLRREHAGTTTVSASAQVPQPVTTVTMPTQVPGGDDNRRTFA